MKLKRRGGGGKVSITLHQLLQLLAYLGGGGGGAGSPLLCISCSSCWPTWVEVEEGQSLHYSASAAPAPGFHLPLVVSYRLLEQSLLAP
jgi:hypothetical protein